MFKKQSMINRLSNPINRNRSAAKISKVMSSTVDTKEVLVNLFKSADEQDGGEKDNLEFLMHLDAEITDQGNEKVQEAEFIIVVDRLESMKIVRF